MELEWVMALLWTLMFGFVWQPLIKLSLALPSKAAATGMHGAPVTLLGAGVREYRRMRDNRQWTRAVTRSLWAALIVIVLAMAAMHRLGGASRADDVPAPTWAGSTGAPSSFEVAAVSGSSVVTFVVDVVGGSARFLDQLLDTFGTLNGITLLGRTSTIPLFGAVLDAWLAAELGARTQQGPASSSDGTTAPSLRLIGRPTSSPQSAGRDSVATLEVVAVRLSDAVRVTVVVDMTRGEEDLSAKLLDIFGTLEGVVLLGRTPTTPLLTLGGSRGQGEGAPDGTFSFGVSDGEAQYIAAQLTAFDDETSSSVRDSAARVAAQHWAGLTPAEQAGWAQRAEKETSAALDAWLAAELAARTQQGPASYSDGVTALMATAGSAVGSLPPFVPALAPTSPQAQLALRATILARDGRAVIDEVVRADSDAKTLIDAVNAANQNAANQGSAKARQFNKCVSSLALRVYADPTTPAAFVAIQQADPNALLGTQLLLHFAVNERADLAYGASGVQCLTFDNVEATFVDPLRALAVNAGLPFVDMVVQDAAKTWDVPSAHSDEPKSCWDFLIQQTVAEITSGAQRAQTHIVLSKAVCDAIERWVSGLTRSPAAPSEATEWARKFDGQGALISAFVFGCHPSHVQSLLAKLQEGVAIARALGAPETLGAWLLANVAGCEAVLAAVADVPAAVLQAMGTPAGRADIRASLIAVLRPAGLGKLVFALLTAASGSLATMLKWCDEYARTVEVHGDGSPVFANLAALVGAAMNSKASNHALARGTSLRPMAGGAALTTATLGEILSRMASGLLKAPARVREVIRGAADGTATDRDVAAVARAVAQYMCRRAGFDNLHAAASRLGLANGVDMALLGGAANVAELLETWGEEGVRALAAEVRKNNGEETAAARDTVAQSLGLASGADMMLLGGAANVAELLKTWGEEGVRALAAEMRKGRNSILAEGWEYVEKLRATWGVETVLKIANLLSAHNIHTPSDYLQNLLSNHGGVEGARAEIARREETRLATMEENRRTASEAARQAEIIAEQRRLQQASQARAVPETTYPPEVLAAREAANALRDAATLERRQKKKAATEAKRRERDAAKRRERDAAQALGSAKKKQRPPP